MIHDGYLHRLAEMYDEQPGRVIVHDATWAATPDTLWVSQASGLIDEQQVTLTAEVVDGVLLIGWDDEVSIDIDGALAVGGWLLAEDSGSDATSAVLRSGVHPGGDPPDPYTVTLSGAALEVAR